MSDRQKTSDFYSGAHRYHSRRRSLKSFVLLTLIVGLLSVFISMFFFAMGMLMKNTSAERFLHMAAFYFGGGLLLLVVWWIAKVVQDRTSASKSLSRRSSRERRYQREAPEPAESSSESGAALIIVLGVLAVVTILVARSQMDALFAQRRDQRGLLAARLRAAAGDAARDALARLAADDDLAADHTNEMWAAVREIRDPAGIVTRTKVTDQNRYFNLNNLATPPQDSGRTPAAILLDLMTLCGDFTPVERVDALLDWMDPGEEGAYENKFYRRGDRGYAPPNRPLHAWGELPWVHGFSRDYFRRHERHSINEPYAADMVDCVAILPARKASLETVNVNTASATVLTGILGMEYDELAAALVGMRNQRPIRSLNELVAIAPPDLLKRAQPYLDTRSRFFAIAVQAYAEGRTEQLSVLAQRDADGNVSVLQWVM